MREIIKDQRFKNVLGFLVFYRFVMQLLITPSLLYLGKLLINYYNVQFMTTEKIIILLSKPSIWLFIIFGLVIMMFLLMFELSSVVILSEYKEVDDSLLSLSLDRISWTLRPKNLIVLPIILIVMLGFHFGMTTMITDSFFIPEFIMDTIIKTPSYMFIYTGVSIIAFIIAFYLVFVFHNLFIGQDNFKDSINKSIKMVKNNKINFLFAAAKIAIKVSLLSAITYFIMLSFTGAIIFLLPPFYKFNAISISTLFIINKIIVFFIVNSITAINVMFITSKYEEYKGEVIKLEKSKKIKKTLMPKYVLLALMIITLIFQGFGAYKTVRTFDSPQFLEHKVYVTSHRGNSFQAPENTIAAIRAAIDERADAAEIDVQLSKDGHVVVIHDFTLSRLANDPRKVIDLTLEDLQNLEVGSWFSKDFKGEKIPTLEEVITEAGDVLKLNIELKPSSDEKELAKAVNDILDKTKFKDRVVISSLSRQALKEIKELDSKLDVGYIVPVAIGKFTFEESIDFYSVEMSFLTKSLVEKIKNQGKEVHAWTVNSEEDLKKMQRLQVDNIITDNPLLAKQVLATNIFEKGILEFLSLIETR